MKKIVSSILLIYSISLFSQNLESEQNCHIYICSLLEHEVSKEKPLMVTFDFEMPLSLKENLLTSKLLNDKEKTLFKNILITPKLIPCEALKEILIEKRVINKPGNYEQYDKISFGKTIWVNDKKVFLVVERLVIKANGYPSGGVLLETYNKRCESWIRVEQKVLEYY